MYMLEVFYSLEKSRLYSEHSWPARVAQPEKAKADKNGDYRQCERDDTSEYLVAD